MGGLRPADVQLAEMAARLRLTYTRDHLAELAETAGDFWFYNFSVNSILENMSLFIANYNNEVKIYKEKKYISFF